MEWLKLAAVFALGLGAYLLGMARGMRYAREMYRLGKQHGREAQALDATLNAFIADARKTRAGIEEC